VRRDNTSDETKLGRPERLAAPGSTAAIAAFSPVRASETTGCMPGQTAGPQKRARPYEETFMLTEKLLIVNFSGLLFVDTSSTPWQIWSSVDELGIQPLEITYLKKSSRLTWPDKLLRRSTKAMYW
jgi:hypothetical protein